MADGTTRPIKDVKIGDQVLATDPNTGETRPEPVTDVITSSGDKDLVLVTVKTAEGTGAVLATDEHPFWDATRKTWTDAEDLQPGTTLRDHEGNPVAVSATRHLNRNQTVYNLTIGNLHTYYVTAGSASTLAHNASCELISGEIPAAEVVERGSLVRIKKSSLRRPFRAWVKMHGFKAEWVGKPNVSRFDVMRDADNRMVLVSKDGKVLVPTNYRYVP